jgi:hypothetical protein
LSCIQRLLALTFATVSFIIVALVTIKRKIGQAAVQYDQHVNQLLRPEEETVPINALARLGGRDTG